MIKRLLFFLLIACSLTGKADVYYDIDRFELHGSPLNDTVNVLQRLPDSLRSAIRPDLWKLGMNTAGLSLRFATDATSISAKWTSRDKVSMNHMCPTGIRGLDLYMLMPDNTWAFVGSARPSLSKETSTSTFVKGLPKQMREYMIFLPLYDGVTDLKIGLNVGAELRRPAALLPVADKPVVMYGTSILQGGCATRPGMAHTNILQRMLNRDVINLGFSGNAHLDKEIAQLMAQIDASVFVIDVLPNNTLSSLNQKLGPFYNIIRAAHPDTPILLVESPYYPRCRVDKSYRAGIVGLNRGLRKFYDERKAQGDNNIYYFEGENILDDDLEGSIDGTHFTDIGFQHFAQKLYPVLDKLINIR